MTLTQERELEIIGLFKLKFAAKDGKLPLVCQEIGTTRRTVLGLVAKYPDFQEWLEEQYAVKTAMLEQTLEKRVLDATADPGGKTLLTLLKARPGSTYYTGPRPPPPPDKPEFSVRYIEPPPPARSPAQLEDPPVDGSWRASPQEAES